MLLDERREPPQQPRPVGRGDSPPGGNASFARATAASVSSTPACSSSAIGSSVAGLSTVSVTASPRRPPEARASSTSASEERLVHHLPPDARGRRARTAGTGPREPRPSRRLPKPSRQARRRRGRSPGGGGTSPARAPRGSPPSRVPSARPRRARENVPGTSLCASLPTSSGRCWTRSPPRTTFRSCEPRQTASTGRSRCERRLEQRELASVTPLCGVSVSGCGSAP